MDKQYLTEEEIRDLLDESDDIFDDTDSDPDFLIDTDHGEFTFFFLIGLYYFRTNNRIPAERLHSHN